jgi:hypothetical protein
MTFGRSVVETVIEASFEVRVYIIPKSKQQQQRLESEIDHNCVEILPDSDYASTASNRPEDGVTVIDLREDNKERNYHCNPSWWSRVHNP